MTEKRKKSKPGDKVIDLSISDFVTKNDNKKWLSPPTFRHSNKATKACTICGRRGHTKLKCPLFNEYSGIPTCQQTTKMQISQKLSLPHAFVSGELSQTDKREVIKSYKSSMAAALVIHNRFPKNGTFVYECTLFGKQKLKPLQEKCLLEFAVVQHLLVQNQNRVIVNELIEDLSVLSANPLKIEYQNNNNNTDSNNLGHINFMQQQVLPSPSNAFLSNAYNRIHETNQLIRSSSMLPDLSQEAYSPHSDLLNQMKEL